MINYLEFTIFLSNNSEIESHWLNFLEIFVDKKDFKKVDLDLFAYYSTLNQLCSRKNSPVSTEASSPLKFSSCCNENLEES